MPFRSEVSCCVSFSVTRRINVPSKEAIPAATALLGEALHSLEERL